MPSPRHAGRLRKGAPVLTCALPALRLPQGGKQRPGPELFGGKARKQRQDAFPIRANSSRGDEQRAPINRKLGRRHAGRHGTIHKIGFNNYWRPLCETQRASFLSFYSRLLCHPDVTKPSYKDDMSCLHTVRASSWRASTPRDRISPVTCVSDGHQRANNTGSEGREFFTRAEWAFGRAFGKTNRREQ